jgi:hypothetical protein
MSEFRDSHAGLGALLRPQDTVRLLIDHQAFQFAKLHSHEPTLVVNNVVGFASPANKPLCGWSSETTTKLRRELALVSTARPTWRSSLTSAMAAFVAAAGTS